MALSVVVCLSGAVNCTTQILSRDGKVYEYDLSSLSHSAGESDSLRVQDSKGNYIYMNVCGPSSEKCKAGTSVCMKDKIDYDYFSLGMLNTQVFSESLDVDPGKGLEVTYSNGDDCDLTNYQTVASFVCDETEVGKIDSAESGECWYKLIIRSKYACGREVMDSSSSEAVTCSAIVSSKDGKAYYYNLSPLSHSPGEADTLRGKDDQGNYVYINICGTSAERCAKGTSVCLRDKATYDYMSLGMLYTQEFSELPSVDPGYGVQVTYSNGDDCDLGRYQTVISLICDKSVKGDVEEIEIDECSYKVTVRSTYACSIHSSNGSNSAPRLFIIFAFVLAAVFFGLK